MLLQMFPPQTDPSAYCLLIAPKFSPGDNPEPAWLVPGPLGARRLEATKTQEGSSCRLKCTPAAAAWSFLRKLGEGRGVGRRKGQG